MKHLVFDVQFRIEDVLEYVRRSAGDPACGIESATVHFVHLREPDHPTWRTVPRGADGALYPNVIVIRGNATDWPCLSCPALLPNKRSAAPRVAPRLSEYVYGRLLLCSNDAERIEVLRDAAALALLAMRRYACDPSLDAFAVYQLLFDWCGNTPQYEAAKQLCTQCLIAVQFEQQRSEHARIEVAAGQRERIPFLAVGHGEASELLVRVSTCTVLWVFSDSADAVRIARTEFGADIVVQMSILRPRVLVVARDTIGAKDAVGQTTGSLVGVAAVLRLLDARKRRGGAVESTAVLCESGLTSPSGTPPVFTLAPSGNVCGNWDGGDSCLSMAEVQHAIRSVINARNSVIRRAAINGKTISSESLAEAIR